MAFEWTICHKANWTSIPALLVTYSYNLSHFSSLFFAFPSKYWTEMSDQVKIILGTCICKELEIMRAVPFQMLLYCSTGKTSQRAFRGWLKGLFFAKKRAWNISSSPYSTPLLLSPSYWPLLLCQCQIFSGGSRGKGIF